MGYLFVSYLYLYVSFVSNEDNFVSKGSLVSIKKFSTLVRFNKF